MSRIVQDRVGRMLSTQLCRVANCVFCVVAMAVSGNVATAQRAVWKNSTILGSPEPPPPLRQVLRFPELKFSQPLSIERDSARQRMWVVTREAKIWSFPDQQDVKAADAFVDLRAAFDQLTPHSAATKVNSAYGLAFHPDYPRVPVCWLTYTLQTDDRQHHLEDGTRLSRFNIVFDNNDVPRCDVASEKILISWLEGGHNGGCLRFGPDGYLYVSAGDGEVPNPPDPRRSGQNVTNVLSTILRIDVNPLNDGPLYSIPKDNPFADVPSRDSGNRPDDDLYYAIEEAIPEIWAYGFRNPWKMNFGPNGQLWVGDVGWEMYEMVYNVKPGANYGWSIVEGPQPVIPDGKRGPTPIVPAAVAYSHAEGASVTGGFVYQGSSFPELHGKYIFGDYETRRIWSADITPDPDGGADALSNMVDLVDPSIRIVAFGEDTSGELLLLHFDEGVIYGLARNESSAQPSEFPRRLSQTGLFADTQNQIPSEGVIPFSINEPMWQDGASGYRFLGVPSEQAIRVLPKARRMKESSLREQMEFPGNSVLVRTVTLEDDSNQLIALETQLLHFNGRVWNPYTYVWNPEQTDAELAPAAGTELNLAEYGTFQERPTWKVHSRSECTRCHNSWAGGVLAFTLPQLNCSVAHGQDAFKSEVPANQLVYYRDIGLLTGAVPRDIIGSTDPRVAGLASSADPGADLESRARSYLSVNCAHCHQRGAGGTATIDLRHNAKTEEMRAIGAAPVQGTFQIAGGSIIEPGKPHSSVLLYRMACSGRGRMPHIGSRMVDVHGLTVVRDWVSSLKSEQPDAASSPSLDSTSAAMKRVAEIDSGAVDAAERDRLLLQARDAAPEIRNLFARFQPLEYRQQLNRTLNASHLLALRGDATRGAALFADKRIQCINCHRLGDQGGQVGPELHDVGKRLKRDEILEAILYPSKKIEPKFAAWTALTIDGRVHSGLMTQRTEGAVTLRTAKNETVRIAKDELEELLQQTVSLMPDRLVNDLADDEIADLLQFLSHQTGGLKTKLAP